MNRAVSQQKTRRTIRLADRKRTFEVLFLTVVFVISIFVFSAMAVSSHNRSAEKLVHARATQTASRFCAYIQRTLVLVKKASKSNDIKAWFSDSENQDKRKSAYYEMLDYSGVLLDPHLYFGIADSLGKFSFRPGTTLDEFVPYKKLDQNEPRDSWYFKCAASDKEYVLDFDKDLDTQEWKLWLNHKVEADSKLAGVFCATFEIKDLYQELFADYDLKRERGYIIDENGTVLTCSDSTKYYSGEKKIHIFDVCKDKKFRILLEKTLTNNDASSPQITVMKSTVVPFRYKAFMKIPGTSWSVVTVFDSDYFTGITGWKNSLPLPLALLVSLIVYAIVSSLHTAHLVFKPIACLTWSIAESDIDSVEIYGYNRADEIGDLSRAIRESRTRLNSTYAILHEVICDKEEQERLLYAVNKTAGVLLTSPDDDRFEDSIIEAMGVLGECLNLDRVCVWKTETIDNILHYVPKYEWRGDIYKEQKSEYDNRKICCFDSPVWNEKFARGECVNGPVRNLTKIERDLLSYNKLKSVLLIPVYSHKKLWGYINFGDCRNERTFEDEEINILRSAGMMMVSAIDRNIQTAKIREAQDYTKLMLDATPLACHLWDRSLNCFDCNEETLKFYGLKNKQEFNDKFPELSPEYQSDGSRSMEAAYSYIRQAFDEGRVSFQWNHQMPDGELVPSDVILVRVPYGDDYVVAGYTRDLRKHNQMMSEIDKKDRLLQIMNHAALLLLSREEKIFERAISKGLDLFAGLADIDRMSVFCNSEEPNGELCFSQMYRWRKDSGGTVKVWNAFQKVPYTAFSPMMTAALQTGECIAGSVNELPDNEIFRRFDCVTVLIIPIFDDGKFWGVTLFERLTEENFTEYETSVLRSASCMLANAIIRNEEAESTRRANEQAQTIIDALPVSLTIWNKDRKVINCSQYAVDLFGFSSKQETLERIVDYLPEYQPCGKKSVDLLDESANEAFKTGYDRLEWTHMTVSGEPILFDANAIRIKYEGDYALMLFSRDIREEKKMLAGLKARDEMLVSQAETIRQANEQAQLMLDAAPFAITMWDKNFHVVDCSQTALDVFGFSSKQDLIEHFVDNAPEYQPCGRRSMEILAEAATEAFQTGSCHLEWTGRTEDGESIIFDDTAVRVKYKNDYALMLYSRDIREEKKMLSEIAGRDKMLADQAHWYKSLLDGIPLPLSVTDENMNLTFTNNASESLFGKVRGELLGQHCSILDCPMCNSPDCSVVRAQHGLKQTWFKMNGSSYQVDTEIIRNLDGKTSGYLEVLHDITEVETMARRQADEANEAKTLFLANMSHEMRTPLNAIMGLSELTLSSENLDEETQSTLVKIHNAGATLVSTVNDILDISKIEAGKFELVPIEYELPSLLNDAITQNAARIDEKPIKFTLDIERDLPMRLLGDELRIKEILNNLLSNAFKYTREGTVELGMRSAREGEDVWLSAWVKDTGIGIQAENIEKLFEDYVQLDKKSNRKIQGTGLGLAITKRLVELMNGTISVESEYGKGSVFRVRVKQKYVSDETIGPDMVNNLKNFRYIERKRRQNLRLGYPDMSYARVLVVDDIVTNLDVAKGMLKPYGMKVDCLTSGQEAVDAIRKEKVKYNAIFMDHMMPEMDGIEAVKIIRNEIGTEYAKTIPIIALTANAITGNEEKFLNVGFQAFISKPIEVARLDSVVREWVQDREQEKLLEEKKININGELVQDTRSGKERRRGSGRRNGIDRRFFGSAISGIDLVKGMERFGNNREIYFDVLNSFAVNTRPLLDRIREGIGIDGDISLNDYAVIVHGIKGSSRGIGALPLGDKAEALEHAAKKGDNDFVAENHNSFIDAVEKLIAGIEESLAGQKRENPKPKKEKPDSETLEKLLTACRDYNMDKADAAITDIEKWEYEADDGLAAWLKENVDLMNFTEVEEKLSALLNDDGQGEKNVVRAI